MATLFLERERLVSPLLLIGLRRRSCPRRWARVSTAQGGDTPLPGSMPHRRRYRHQFVDVFQSEGSVIAEEAIRRIAGLYAVEKDGRGRPPEERVRLRQARAK